MAMDIGIIRPVNIDDEMRGSYLDYAMSVIVARALPDSRDGLKPVHRRILYTMQDMGLRANSGYKKSARIVGDVLGKYHPHGDQAVYEAMARMAQDFSMRYLLVDGQGNFGSVDGDSPAAMRYTEARLTRVAEELLTDLNSDTIDFVDNYDGTLREPEVLPAGLPNLLLNGTSGIAVGMSTNIPPHNLRELNAAIGHLIDNYERIEEVSVDDLMQFVTAPDFPTGAIILAGPELREMYATGRGHLVVRAKAEIEEMRGDRYRIVFTEIPYQTNKVSVIERIAQLVKDDKLDQISDLRDESDRHGMAIVVELKRNAQPQKVLNQLYKHTQLESTFSVQILALVDGEPRTLSLKRALQIWIDHRREVVRRRSEFELKNARARAHILEGYLKALDNIDAIIATIRRASDTDEARQSLIANFDLSEAQAQAILELQLRRIASLEQQKITEEFGQVSDRIAYLVDLLASAPKVLAVIKAELNELAVKYGDERRTAIDYHAKRDWDDTDFVRDEEVLISITRRGYIKRTPVVEYRSQNRGGRGVMGMTTREEDAVRHIFSANSLDHCLFFSNRGKVYAERAFMVPEADRNGKGMMINNLLALEGDEKVTAIAHVSDFETGFFVLCTRLGRIKRVEIKEFEVVRAGGLIAIDLEDGDELGWVYRSSGEDDILLVTAHGQALRFDEDEVRVMGRTARGVNAMRVKDNDALAGLAVINDQTTSLLVIMAYGIGKRSPIHQYPVRGRFGQGVLTVPRGVTTNPKVGVIIGVEALTDQNMDVTAITNQGITIRTPAGSIRMVGRAGLGVKVMNLGRNERIVSIAVVEGEVDSEAVAANGALDGDVSLNGAHSGLVAGADGSMPVVEGNEDELSADDAATMAALEADTEGDSDGNIDSAIIDEDTDET
jgi:DNA gyrase subunit A